MALKLGRWDGTTDVAKIRAIDDVLGNSGFTRHYLPVGQNWDGGSTQFSYETNRIPCIVCHSWTTKRVPIPWLDIYHGLHDDEILASATGLRDLSGRNVPAYIVFHHEPENEDVANPNPSGDIDGKCGTRDEFKLAAEHFRTVIREVLTTADALFGVTLMAGSYRSGRWREWVPAHYQFLGVDGYSHGTLNKKGEGETFSSIILPAHNAAVEKGKKLFIEEIGVAEVPTQPTFKPQFFRDMRVEAKEMPELLGIEYSNVDAKADYRIRSSPASEAAYLELANDPYFIGGD